MSAKDDDRTNEEKREAVRELLGDPEGREVSINSLRLKARVSWELAADEWRKFGLQINHKLLGDDGKRRPRGEGRVRSDRKQLNGERTEPLLALYDLVVRQLGCGCLDLHELQRLADRAADAADYHRKVLSR
jgi:hypothetical protein